MDLQETQARFENLLMKVDEKDKDEFLCWIRRYYLVRACSGQRPAFARTHLRKIARDIIQNEKVPVSGIIPSETITIPSSYENPENVIFVDRFLREEYDLKELLDKDKLKKYFCMDCKSRNISQMKMLTESTSKEKINFVFSTLLSPLNGKVVVTLGSRLGGWLYAAYLHTPAPKIIGIEENNDLCQLQKKIIEKHNMQDRIKIINSNAFDASDAIGNANVVILQNVTNAFPKENDQVNLLQLFKTNLKSGTLIVTLTKIEALQSAKKHPGDLSTWLKLKTDSEESGMLHLKEFRETDKIYLYEVL